MSIQKTAEVLKKLAIASKALTDQIEEISFVSNKISTRLARLAEGAARQADQIGEE